MLAVIAGLMLLAALAGPEPLTGVLGTPDRRLGVLAWLAFAGFALAGARLDDRDLSVLGLGAAAAGTLLGLVAAIELAGDEARAGSLLGQPAYLGGAAILLLALSGVPILAGGGGWRTSLGACGVIGAGVALAASGSRAALVGAAAAGCVSLVRPAGPRLRVAVGSIGAAVPHRVDRGLGILDHLAVHHGLRLSVAAAARRVDGRVARSAGRAGSRLWP